MSIEASIFVPDLDPPQTQITSVDASSPAFVVEFSGADTGGSGMQVFELYVAIDGGDAQKVAAIDAGPAGADGVHQGSAAFQAIADGHEHTYPFFTVGIDRAGNVEVPIGTFEVTAAFAAPEQLEIVSFVVQHGMTQRSYIRNLEITFNQADELQAMIDNAGDRMQLEHVDESGSHLQIAQLLFGLFVSLCRQQFAHNTTSTTPLERLFRSVPNWRTAHASKSAVSTATMI